MKASNTAKLILLVSILICILLVPNGKAYSTSPFLITPYFGSFAVSQEYSETHRAHDYLMRYDPVLAAGGGSIITNLAE